MRSTSGSRTCSIIARMLLAPGAGVEIGVDAQHFVDLAADRHHRIERRHRLLKDHRHGGGAQLPQAAVAGGQQFLADQLDAAAGRHQRALLQQSHHRQRRHRFARAAFADQAQRFAFAHLQRDAVDDARALPGFLPRPTTRLSMSRTMLVMSSLSPPSLRGANDEAIHISLCRRTSDCSSLRSRNDGDIAVTCRPPAASCGDRARRARRRRSG